MERLSPTLGQLTQEYVLVQAWKKAASYIRYHNWFADTLELDRAAADLPSFIDGLSNRLKSGSYRPTNLRLVPAPKSQRWAVSDDGSWQPQKKGQAKIRPLAHVNLADQVAATAVMLCLSERVETAQGDPRGNYQSASSRKSVISYGNRLFCDTTPDGSLVHRWGSSKLYRAYFQDYRAFLSRPETVAASLTQSDVLIVQSDLRQFYDRVTPKVLHEKLRQLQMPGDDERFFELSESLLNWEWAHPDARKAEDYRIQSEIPAFEKIALPQGLVAAGFLSNIVLLDFDRAILEQFGREVAPGIILSDACRYVDDIRLTISLAPGVLQENAQERVMAWIEGILAATTSGLQFSPEKTITASVGGQSQPLVRQSRKMERIQSAISGGFDASGGEEVIQAIEALVRSQMRLEMDSVIRSPSPLKAISDVKDETIGRFAAGRFRKTFRSLRPLLGDEDVVEQRDAGEQAFRRARLSQSELDEEAHSFALTLIERWIADPANVRLLRVALDLWPSPKVLGEILALFEPYLSTKGQTTTPQMIVHYCLSEILRAGATETGFVDDQECLPQAVDLPAYRQLLLQTAIRIATGNVSGTPWYLLQQSLLYIAVHDPRSVTLPDKTRSARRYWEVISFLRGDRVDISDQDFSVLSVVVRRSFLNLDEAIRIVRTRLTAERFTMIAERDIEFAHDLYRAVGSEIEIKSAIAFDLGTVELPRPLGQRSLREVVSKQGPLNPLRSEIGVLTFACEFLKKIRLKRTPKVITPTTVHIATVTEGEYLSVSKISWRASKVGADYTSIYSPPGWCDESQRWRFQLGFLLRYILTARIDFSLPVRPTSWKEGEPIYRPTRGHWFQRQYGFYNGHEAFGDDWLAISQFTENLLFSLLRWPGCRTYGDEDVEPSIDEILQNATKALAIARRAVGQATGTLLLEVAAPIPGTQKPDRPMRACVVQSLMPQKDDFNPHDLEMQSPTLRRKHRRHLSTALAAVEKMLDLRETHKPVKKRLDWLILPELAVHPDDVRTHLVPFARAFKTIILTGLTYERLVAGQPLVNSALWIIPRMIPGQGLQVVVRRQGKKHLSPLETGFNSPVPQITGFRPCQWLIGYEWSAESTKDPLWLSASICYDATDLRLASDLKHKSDVFAIPALNQDVGTFDQMAQALHYHMFQMVLIANNGAYGGSNAHMPKGEAYQRQVFHTHGQPQATISFLEIDNIEDMKLRRHHGINKQEGWKHPPAGK